MKRILSVLLALVMIVGMIPMSILSASAAGDTFEKITAAPADWSGTYLIVYEDGNVAFDGSRTTLDAVSNTVAVTIDNGSIAATDALKAATFTINADGHIQSKSGYYIGQTSNANGLKSSQTTTYTNTISFNSDGTVNFVSGGAYLRYNATSGQTRFRYYKSSSYSGQKAICLYKLVEGSGDSGETECNHNYTSVVTAPNCTEGGYTTYTCSVCNGSYVSDRVDALGHSYGDWVVDPAATCTEAGQQTQTCATCGDVQTEVIAATGHTYANGVCGVCGADAPAAVATLITSADQFVSGDYILMVSSGYAMGAYDSGWVTAVKPAMSDGEIVDAAGGVWTLTVDGTSVVIKAANGVTIAPKGGNNNGITSGDYFWAWSVNEDGTFVFAGTGEDTVKLASNTTANSGDNKFRAYKTATIDGSTATYLANFSVYKLNAGGEVEPEDPETPACTHTNTTTTTVPEACEVDGSITITCDDCGETLSVEVIPALDHNYIDGVCDECGAEDPNAGTEENGPVIFELGANGSAAHVDGSSATTYTETVGKYTLSITATDKMYTGGFDLTGNSCIKLGTGSVVGGFSFTVPDNVATVIISVAKYKSNTSIVNVNGTEYALTNNSNDGAYDEITVDTSTNKTVSVTTVSGASRAMINSITFIPSAEGESDHTCVWDEGTVTKDATCLEEGILTYSCTVEGCDKIKTEAIAKTGHAMTNGTCSVCGAEYYTLSTTLNNNDSVVIYYPGSKVALTATASGKKLAGATVTIDESGLLADSNVTIMQVQYLTDSTTDFYLICDGMYLTSGDTGNSLTFADAVSDYAVWYIETVEGGDSTVYIHSRNAAYNGNSQSLEFYSGFTTYGTNTTDAYKFQLYTKGENAVACEHEWSDWEIVTNATCTEAGEQKSVCSKCGAEKTQTIAATGHSYVFGDTEVTCTAGDVNVAKTDIINVPKTADSNVYYVEGVVTFVDGGTVYMQDATGGVALRLASGVSAPAVGTLVEAIGTCSVYNGLIQLQNADFEAVSTDNTVDAQEVTLAELMADTELSYLSEKVSMKGLTITAVGTYSTSYKNVDYTVSDGTNEFKLYRAPAATADSVLKVGDVINVVGVVGIYNADYQLRVVEESDIVLAPTVELTHISLDPTNDALGYKAAASNMPEGAELGIRLWVTEDRVITNKVAKANISLRLYNILANNGGETTINAQAVIILDGEVIAESTIEQTSMKEVIGIVNGMTLDSNQQAAVYALYERYSTEIDAWLGEENNIKNWGSTEA